LPGITLTHVDLLACQSQIRGWRFAYPNGVGPRGSIRSRGPLRNDQAPSRLQLSVRSPNAQAGSKPDLSVEEGPSRHACGISDRCRRTAPYRSDHGPARHGRGRPAARGGATGAARHGPAAPASARLGRGRPGSRLSAMALVPAVGSGRLRGRGLQARRGRARARTPGARQGQGARHRVPGGAAPQARPPGARAVPGGLSGHRQVVAGRRGGPRARSPVHPHHGVRHQRRQRAASPGSTTRCS